MVLFQQNKDWLQQDDQALQLRGRDTFTVTFWLRPEAGGTAVLPFAFVFADDLVAPTQQFVFLASGGLWFYGYDWGGGTEIQVVAPFSNDWRFVALIFSPGTTPGTTKVRALTRLATNATPGAWEFDFTYDNAPLILNDSWQVHTLSTGQDAATFGYYGHLQHWKTWSTSLTPEQAWRESQLALPMVTAGLLAWNPVQQEFDGQFFRQQQGGATGGGYAVGLNTPAADTSHAPLPTRPTPGALFLNAPNPNPTLAGGSFALEGTGNLQGRLGLAARIGSGVAAFVGGLLVVAGASNPSLGGGSLGLVGAPLAAALGQGATIDGGAVQFQGEPLAAALGLVAALPPGDLTLADNGALTVAQGLAAALSPGDLVLAGEGLQAVTSAPPDIIQGFEATVANDQPVVTVDAGAVTPTAPAGPTVVVDAGAAAATVNPADVVASTEDPPAVNVSC